MCGGIIAHEIKLLLLWSAGGFYPLAHLLEDCRVDLATRVPLAQYLRRSWLRRLIAYYIGSSRKRSRSWASRVSWCVIWRSRPLP